MPRVQKQKLILCSDWEALIKEINRQLKCHDLIVEAKTRPDDDQITVSIVRPRHKKPNFGKL